ncbi:helix-turn-helix transcriptional regulator [Actinospica sp. MGRD01-02]|uniref:Helix-turn-helix transcriptional regulator n=1 Tax=Actinospica acidithermotolerans TaxID=2828514 RepID=A0A941EI48_9ACTN|nr:helix-turn-helix transcriptional regulator [Actinospica acidithermotolerans]
MVRRPLGEDDAKSLAGVFKALSDPVRLRLLSLIASFEGGEACVCDVTSAFNVSQPTISHHLRVLREAGLIDSERRGTWVYYWVLPDALKNLGALLATDGVTSAGDATPSARAATTPSDSAIAADVTEAAAEAAGVTAAAP